jgi:ribosomal protein L29
MAKKISLTNHTAEELNKLTHEKREALRTLRFSGSGGKNHNVKQGKMLRKEIARAMTQLTALKNPKPASVPAK